MAETYNSWSALRAQPHVTLVRARLPDSPGGAVCATWSDGSAVIVIDPSLGRRARHAALAHELVHLERGGACAGSPFFATKEERAVWREVARRLVPDDRLSELIMRAESLDEPLTPHMVSEEFDCTHYVAELALTLRRAQQQN